MTAVTTPLDQRSLARGFVAGSLLPIVTAFLAVLVVLAVFTMGVRRGMDGVIAADESEQTAWAIAISEMVYGLEGYVTHSAVVETIIKHVRGGTSGPGDPDFDKKVSDPDLLNAAISAALSLGPQPEGFISERSLRTMLYDDIGMVDYDKIAFALFGFQVQSLYYTFFVILSLSASVFLLQFWRRPMAQVVLLCNLVAFWLDLHTAMFTPPMPSLSGMGHSSTLAILPMWHVALLMTYRTRLSWSAAILGLVQIAIMIFVIRIRGSAAWSVIFLTGLAVFLAFQFWRASHSGERSVGKVARVALKWPFVLLLVGLAANKLYTDAKLHPAYFTDDIMPHPAVWHSAYLGIFVSPTLVAATGDPKRAWGDTTAYAAALEYLRKKGFLATRGEYLSPWTHTYKMRLHDSTMRAVYLDLIKEYPFTTLGMYLYEKPLRTILFMRMYLSNIPIECWLVVLLGAAAVATVTVVGRAVTPAEVRNAAWLGFGAVLFSSLPSLWAYPALQSCADIMLCALALGTLVMWALCERLLRLLSGRFTAGGEARA